MLSLLVTAFLRMVSLIHPKPHLVVQAGNHPNIKTYGQCLLELDLNLRRLFRWIYLVVDMLDSILGVDFLHGFIFSHHLRASSFVDHIIRLSFSYKQERPIV